MFGIVLAIIFRKVPTAILLTVSGRSEVIEDGSPRTTDALRCRISCVFFLNTHHTCATVPHLTEPSTPADMLLAASSSRIIFNVVSVGGFVPQISFCQSDAALYRSHTAVGVK